MTHEEIQRIKGAVAGALGWAASTMCVTKVYSFRYFPEWRVRAYSWMHGWCGTQTVDQNSLRVLDPTPLDVDGDEVESADWQLCDADSWPDVDGRRDNRDSRSTTGSRKAYRLSPLLRVSSPRNEACSLAMQAVGRPRLPMLHCETCALWGAGGIGYPMLSPDALSTHLAGGPDAFVDAAEWHFVRDSVRSALQGRSSQEQATFARAEDGLPLVLPGMEIGPLHVRIAAEPAPLVWLAGTTLVLRSDVLAELRALGFTIAAVPVVVVERADGVSAEWQWYEIVAHPTAIGPTHLMPLPSCPSCRIAGSEMCFVNELHPDPAPWLAEQQPLADVPFQRLQRWYPWLLVTTRMGAELARRFPQSCEVRMLTNRPSDDAGS
jgi:hypothetical protein